MNERLYFAVYAEGRQKPTAVFAVIEDAMDWAEEHFGHDTFRIKGYLVPVVTNDGSPSGRPD